MGTSKTKDMILIPDTNIYISAVLVPHSNPGYIYRAWKDRRVTFALSDDILSEIREALRYERVQMKLGWSSQKLERYLRRIRSRGTVVRTASPVTTVEADPTDNKFLACAVEAQADAVVTGDRKHLLPLKSFQGIPIITPRQCVEQLKSATRRAA